MQGVDGFDTDVEAAESGREKLPVPVEANVPVLEDALDLHSCWVDVGRCSLAAAANVDFGGRLALQSLVGTDLVELLPPSIDQALLRGTVGS
jgi:hypothetical protein